MMSSCGFLLSFCNLTCVHHGSGTFCSMTVFKCKFKWTGGAGGGVQERAVGRHPARLDGHVCAGRAADAHQRRRCAWPLPCSLSMSASTGVGSAVPLLPVMQDQHCSQLQAWKSLIRLVLSGVWGTVFAVVRCHIHNRRRRRQRGRGGPGGAHRLCGRLPPGPPHHPQPVGGAHALLSCVQSGSCRPSAAGAR